ncbi:hypothetical protein [Lentzea flaviverrucosa]|uniref:Uncharacterized protein n=1 Tax=Lentzea flaviverrucosa TaxID=200379 RepID=A0A1H9VNP9_9PSEU|nr:hypothetical protein [Lentzea flaviverrucosa]RDI23733.1 hypothetical protein DFR72_110139 [Lentzea flaviverrucosa]SES23189.1 hypothetical protein SAMN05216195_110197 [Lentzea flaviverrucosa]
MTPEHSPVVPAPAVPPLPPLPEQRRPDSQPVSQVDWFRSAPNGGTVFVSPED